MSEAKLHIRYCLMCDDRSGDPKDIGRVAELVCSLISTREHLLPYVAGQIILYTRPESVKRFGEILSLLGPPGAQIIGVRDPDDQAFAAGIVNATPVDRICIERMLTDFRVLPSDAFRLLLGTDCYFYRPPQELISYTWNPTAREKVLYMIDDFTFLGLAYRLRYYRPPILEGLLGDFYCLAPGVTLRREAITGCLRLIDGWPTSKRFRPARSTAVVPEQQAASMLLGLYPARRLPARYYNHRRPKPDCVLLHERYPWDLIARGVMEPTLTEKTLDAWQRLGYEHILRHAQPLPRPSRMRRAYQWARRRAVFVVRSAQRAYYRSLDP